MDEPEEDFATLFEASVQATQYKRGQTIEGTIVAIGPEVAFVNVGGKGEAVMIGLRAAAARGFSHALQIDADGQHDASDIPRFLAAADANREAVVAGYPVFDASAPRGRRIARWLTHVWVWIETLSFTIRDSMCGFRVYPLDPVIKLAAGTRMGRRMDFDPEIVVRMAWSGVPVINLETRVRYLSPEQGGVSHFRMLRDNLLISWMHTRMALRLLALVWRRPWPRRIELHE